MNTKTPAKPAESAIAGAIVELMISTWNTFLCLLFLCGLISWLVALVLWRTHIGDE